VHGNDTDKMVERSGDLGGLPPASAKAKVPLARAVPHRDIS